MCNNLVCKVCGGVGVNQRHFHPYHVTLCNDHFNELHILYQEKKARKIQVKFHLAARLSHQYHTDEKKANAWIDAEHKWFMLVDGIVKKMKKDWDKKNKKKKTPRPKPSDAGELAEKN